MYIVRIYKYFVIHDAIFQNIRQKIRQTHSVNDFRSIIDHQNHDQPDRFGFRDTQYGVVIYAISGQEESISQSTTINLAAAVQRPFTVRVTDRHVLHELERNRHV